MNNRRPVKNIEQLLTLTPAGRTHAFRSLTEEEKTDILVVCKKMPKVDMEVNYEGKTFSVSCCNVFFVYSTLHLNHHYLYCTYHSFMEHMSIREIHHILVCSFELFSTCKWRN